MRSQPDVKTGRSALENACLVTVYLRNASDFAAMGSNVFNLLQEEIRPPVSLSWSTEFYRPRLLWWRSPEHGSAGWRGKEDTLKPAGWSDSPLPYSYGVQSGNTVFLAGLISRNGVDNTNVKGNVTTQTKYIMGNAEAILKEADMTLNDVVQSRVYITDTANFQAMNAAYRSAFTAAPPVHPQPSRPGLRVAIIWWKLP